MQIRPYQRSLSASVSSLYAGFLLFIGLTWLAFVMWMLLSIAGVADAPENWLLAFGIWSGYSAGPVILIVGAGVLLRSVGSKSGGLFVLLGCLLLTGFAVYNSIAGMHREPLQAPPTYWFYGLIMIVTLVADFAGYKLIRPILTAPAGNP